MAWCQNFRGGVLLSNAIALLCQLSQPHSISWLLFELVDDDMIDIQHESIRTARILNRISADDQTANIDGISEFVDTIANLNKPVLLEPP